MSYNAKEVGERIQKLRILQGLSQEKLAEELNVSANTIAKIECGLRKPSIELLIEISLYFKISADYILTGKTKKDIAEDLKEKIDKEIEKIDEKVEKLLKSKEELFQLREKCEQIISNSSDIGV